MAAAFYRLPLVPHAAAVVNYNAHRHRDIGVGKVGERLGGAIFEDTKIRLLEVVNDFLLLIQHRRMDDHFIHIDADGELPSLSLGRVRGIRRLSAGNLRH